METEDQGGESGIGERGVNEGREKRGSYWVKEAEKDCWRGAKLEGAAAATAASARSRVESMVIEKERSNSWKEQRNGVKIRELYVEDWTLNGIGKRNRVESTTAINALTL